MAILIGTDVLIDAERADADPLGALADETAAAISVITVSELLHGVHRAPAVRATARLAYVESLLASIPAVPITAPVARVHAALGARLGSRGQTIGAHDLWIAATAVAHGAALLTRNAGDVGRIEELQLIGD